MSLIIGRNNGAVLVTNVSDDNMADRLSSINRHLGDVSTWTTSAGQVTYLKDGSEINQFNCSVPGPYSGNVQLVASLTSQTIARSPVFTIGPDEKAEIIFKVKRSHDRDFLLSQPAATVTTQKLGSSQMSGRATVIASAAIGVDGAAGIQLSTSMVAIGNKDNSASSSMLTSAIVSANGDV